MTGAGTSAMGDTWVCLTLLGRACARTQMWNFNAIATTDIANPETYLKDGRLSPFARSGNSPESVKTVDLLKPCLTTLS